MSSDTLLGPVVVDVPVTLRITIGFPDGLPIDAARAAVVLACQAADRLGYVSQERIRAFNAMNRLDHFTPGVIESVKCLVDDLAPGM